MMKGNLSCLQFRRISLFLIPYFIDPQSAHMYTQHELIDRYAEMNASKRHQAANRRFNQKLLSECDKKLHIMYDRMQDRCVWLFILRAFHLIHILRYMKLISDAQI